MATRTDVQTLGRELAKGARASEGVDRIFAFYPTLLRLLLRGRPLTTAEVAAAAGLPEAEVAAALSVEPIERDGDGRVLGAGLTIAPTPHRFRVDGRELYTWCALDTLTFPPLLGVTAEVESPC